MRIFSAGEVETGLDYADLVETLRTAFQREAVVPLRHHHSIPTEGREATLLLMPAWSAPAPAPAHLGVKVVTVYPDNATRDLPSVLGTYLLLDGPTGVPVASIDGPTLTARRTAAASALAADYLARPDARNLLMVGTGRLAGSLIEAHTAVRPIRQTVIWGRDRDKAVRLADRLDNDTNRITATDDLAAAATSADIISCATTSQDPLIHGDWLRAGVHVDLVGGFRPDMREADDDVMGRGRIFADTRAGVLAEAGDIIQPLDAGLITADDIAGDLFELCQGRCEGRRSPDEITVFKSVGSALEDLAAAEHLLAGEMS
ncbi:MAG: ornithine cyclodeaminase family protein [Alphaproteobacteria bacterium]|nr:ornithine cyclodeaminase family protein [Alphaproteobacteria bacterium]